MDIEELRPMPDAEFYDTPTGQIVRRIIREHDRRLAARLRESAGPLREDVPIPYYAATKTAHLLADLLEADDA